MKRTIVMMDLDPIYSKKFCNQAIKISGDEYIFLTFQNMKCLKEYLEENKVEALIISENLIDMVDDLNIDSIYILNEKIKDIKKEGKKIYVYKLQNIKQILICIENDLKKKFEKNKREGSKGAKLVLVYSPIYIKDKGNFVRKIAKAISRKKKSLIVEIDEFDNYKGKVGLSNIIYKYKENALDIDSIKREIINEKDQDFVRSVTYPEDIACATNIDLANIMNEIKGLDYDYIFVNSDTSFNKCQYIADDADKIILIDDKENEKVKYFKNYIELENQLDYKKIINYDIGNPDSLSVSNFAKECFEKNV